MTVDLAPLGKDIPHMQRDVLPGGLAQFHHLQLSEPHRLPISAQLNLPLAIFAGLSNHLRHANASSG